MNRAPALAVVLLLLSGFAFLCAGTVEVILPDGSAAAGAKAACIAKAMFLHIRNGEVLQHYGDALPVLSADGRITVPDNDAGRWVFLHPDGWADVDISSGTRKVQLERWNEIHGEIDAASGSGVPATAGFSRVEARGLGANDRGAVYWTSEAQVSGDGKFALERVPAGRGVVGLAREFEVGRRVQRWKDHPVMVEVPDARAVHVGGAGVEVRGHVKAAADGPALVAITGRSGQPPSYFGATGADGVFVVAGVRPGDYRIVIRPMDHDDGPYHVQREFTVGAADAGVDLGEFGEGPQDVGVYRRVEFPDGIIERVREEAAKQCSRPVKRIWLGQLVHPANVWGARVTFEPELTSGTRATARTFLVEIPGETIRKYYPEHGTEGYGYRFVEGEFIRPRLLEQEVRVFPLATQTVALPIEEPLDYDTALALLKSIEARTWKPKQGRTSSRKNADGSETWTVSGSSWGPAIAPEDLQKIDTIRCEKPGGTINVRTRDRDFGGRSAEFEQKDGGFILVGGGGWVS